MRTPNPQPARGRSCGLVLAALALAVSVPSPVAAQADRRKRDTPGLVLDTGARHAACDELLFTPDGRELLAAGDDKVVRGWPMQGRKLDADHPHELRWPIYRELRGTIYGMALSPHDNGAQVAIGGNGYRQDMVAVISRSSGEIKTVLPPQDGAVVWKVAFSPDGRYLVDGTDHGSIWAADLTAARPQSRRLSPPADGLNRVRLIAFLSATELLSVAQDGRILHWDLAHAQEGARQVGQFRLPKLFRVAISPDRRWLAAAGERAEGDNGVPLNRVELVPLAGGPPRYLDLPADQMPQSLAFDRSGRHLAIGVRVQPPTAAFAKEVGGRVYVFDVTTGARAGRELPASYRVECVAFHPQDDTLLATAGGDNHEVCLWDWQAGTKLSEVRSPGSCLWGVAFSSDGHYLGFQDRRAADPPHPNRRGDGPWRVFDLKACKLLPHAPADFHPLPARNEVGGWSVRFTRDANVWEIVSPDGTAYPLTREAGLYEERVNNMPRCYTFLPAVTKAGADKPPRLVVGHYWGASLYELDRQQGPRLARVMTGHEGDVMALAVSADQTMLVTAGRDQTLAAFSLADWPQHSELGALFAVKGGKLVVGGETAPGSPAWELGLTDGDEVTALVIRDENFVYNADGRDLTKSLGSALYKTFRTGTAEQAVRRLRDARPGREYVVLWKHQGAEHGNLTTVRQRPVWKMFPTRAEKGNDWVLWRWRDFYYDTSSPTADELVGWHVNDPDPAKAPTFYKLAQYQDRFHRPDKIRATLRTFATDAEKVAFAEIEPPEVRLAVKDRALTDQDLDLTLSARARGPGPDQRLDRVQLWLNDHLYEAVPQPQNGTFPQNLAVRVPQAELQSGPIRVRFLAFNAFGGRAEAVEDVTFASKTRPKVGRLFALSVGITDYRAVQRNSPGYSIDNLPAAAPGARDLRALCDKQRQTPLYGGGKAVELVDGQATAANVLRNIRELGKDLEADDWLVVFLAGHGDAEPLTARGNNPDGPIDYKPGSFFFLCADSGHRNGKWERVLHVQALGEALRTLKCRKFILLDACHSGDVASHPIRDLTPQGVPMLIFSACRPDEKSLEVRKALPGGKVLNFALFTQAILEACDAVDDPGDRMFQRADANHDGKLSATELANFIRRRVDEQLAELRRDGAIDGDTKQTPVIFKEPLADVAVFHKP